MPRFYFHIRDGESYELDTVGAEFDSLDLARRDACLAAREIIAEKLMAGDVLDGQRFEITDETGVRVETVVFRSVLNIQ
ncbi:hypothetical protein [Sinorhizobium sp. RAC02]|uniref:DUF6894 family protein n=1 Tax=Sinorhizobium sp. RAC02 TaxID=1842534 RepID=UPI00083E68AC|nr:hypothetical protein [Sinorhizobium sp. RAC02]AOF93018.1 hypothetical protein BSY16_4672 [Sinorhizobium sp. RAC02]